MTWVWHWESTETLTFGTRIDYNASHGLEGRYLSDTPLDPAAGKPVFRTRSKLQRFTKFHCPPIDVSPTVDKLWQDIILQFVPEHRVQLYPVRLVAKDGESEDYSWVIPFDRAACIDLKKTVFVDRDPTYLSEIHIKRYAHKPGCLGSMHLARDINLKTHLVISDELKNALSATGEDVWFFRPEDAPTPHNLLSDRN
jgi:hypothetical protein